MIWAMSGLVKGSGPFVDGTDEYYLDNRVEVKGEHSQSFFKYSYSRAREPSCSGLPWDVSTSSTQFSEFFFYDTNVSGFSATDGGTVPSYSILESARNKRLPISS